MASTESTDSVVCNGCCGACKGGDVQGTNHEPAEAGQRGFPWLLLVITAISGAAVALIVTGSLGYYLRMWLWRMTV